jgi:hypothetical protein
MAHPLRYARLPPLHNVLSTVVDVDRAIGLLL